MVVVTGSVDVVVEGAAEDVLKPFDPVVAGTVVRSCSVTRAVVTSTVVVSPVSVLLLAVVEVAVVSLAVVVVMSISVKLVVVASLVEDWRPSRPLPVVEEELVGAVVVV